MALSKNDLLTLISNNLADNTSGAITPALLRQVVEQMVTADLNLEDAVDQIAKSTVGFEAVKFNTENSDPAQNEGLLFYDSVAKSLAYYDNLVKQLIPRQDKASFVVSTQDTISIPNDPDASAIFTGLTADGNITGFSIDASLGAVRNDTGRDLGRVTGTISMQPSKTGGAASVLTLFSEKSDDGITWVKADSSARVYDVTNTGQSFRTSVSFGVAWLSGEYVRFKAFANDSTLSFESPSITADGDVVLGHSMVWNLKED